MLTALSVGLGAVGGFSQPTPTVQLNAPRAAKRGLFGGTYTSSSMAYGRKGAGINMAQQQRAARKQRNVKRHRSAARR